MEITVRKSMANDVWFLFEGNKRLGGFFDEALATKVAEFLNMDSASAEKCQLVACPVCDHEWWLPADASEAWNAV